MGSFGIPGFDTGLDVQGLVEQILYIEREPIRVLEQKKSDFQRKIDAYNELNSKLSSLLSSLDSLNSVDSFSAKQTSSSNETILTAGASGSASTGTYQIEVNRLALFDNFASDSTFAESNASIGTGSFDLTVGASTATITIDATNNTLEGLKNAINNSGSAARATVINDGSGYRLTITSEESGSENAISIASNSLTLSDGITPFTFARTHDIATEDELDASLTVNGLAITSSSNDVAGVIEGVTLNLRGTSETVTTLVVSNDVEAVKDSIQEFVDHYNDAYGYINNQFRFVEAAGRSGILAGETLLRSIQFELSGLVSRSISGLSGPLDNLAAAGLELQNDGRLKINNAKLDENLAESFAALRDLFILSAKASHSSIEYLGAGRSTEAGSYEITITDVSGPAQAVSPNAIQPKLGSDETLTFTLGSNTSIVSLDKEMLIDQVVTAINAQFAADNMELTASKDGSNHLVITSSEHGSETLFTVVSDETNPNKGTGFGTTGVSVRGHDLAGTFTDTATSTVYAATGSGDVLIGSEGPVKDLRIRFLGTSTGTYGTIDVNFGYAEQMERLLNTYVDSLEGPITGAVERLESNIRSIDDDIDNIEDRLEVRERFLTGQFSRVNLALQELAYLQSSLSAQLQQLNSLL